MVRDRTKIFNKYKGLWVAFADDKDTVVGSGKTLKEAMTQALKKGHNSPIFSRMPETLDTYVGFL
ncbi:DUF5678 domain-containing protein [Candidatus Nomurabacteria bacterium]|nr:DUF5678 domain-containing protein [Candidatus Nomurabacteria bacterium]